MASKRKKGVIDTGGMSDPYNPFEKELQLTREFLSLAKKFGFGVSITTKSTLIERDIDLLLEIAQFAPVICEITITTGLDTVGKMIEPNVAMPSCRFRTIQNLIEKGIFAGIVLMPILPFLEDNENNIVNIIEQAHKAGAKFIYPYFGVTLRENQREWYYQHLEKIFPNTTLVSQYKSTYGDRYECISQKEKVLKKIFEQKCKEYHILFDMEQIVNAYKSKYKWKQLSLFD